jgi:predicted nucleotidyltransferase
VKRDELLEQVKQTVHEIEPDADIILYGSRARGDAHAESEWDRGSLGLNAHEAYGYLAQPLLAEIVGDWLERTVDPGA